MLYYNMELRFTGILPKISDCAPMEVHIFDCDPPPITRGHVERVFQGPYMNTDVLKVQSFITSSLVMDKHVSHMARKAEELALEKHGVSRNLFTNNPLGLGTYGMALNALNAIQRASGTIGYDSLRDYLGDQISDLRKPLEKVELRLEDAKRPGLVARYAVEDLPYKLGAVSLLADTCYTTLTMIHEYER